MPLLQTETYPVGDQTKGGTVVFSCTVASGDWREQEKGPAAIDGSFNLTLGEPVFSMGI